MWEERSSPYFIFPLLGETCDVDNVLYNLTNKQERTQAMFLRRKELLQEQIKLVFLIYMDAPLHLFQLMC